MSNYNWTIDTLYERIQKLKKMAKKERDKTRSWMIGNDINYLYETIRESTSYTIDFRPNTLINNYSLLKTRLNEIPFLWFDYQKFYDISKDFSIPDFDLKTYSLSKKDILELTHDFYKSLDDYFFKLFLKNYRIRKNHIKFSQQTENNRTYGDTLSIASLGESFIDIRRNFTIDDVFTTIHEYFHTISVLISPFNDLECKSLFEEIGPIFMELIAIDFLDPMLNNRSALIERILTHNDYINAFKITSNILSLMAYEKNAPENFKTNKDLNNAMKSCNIKRNDLDELLSDDNSDLVNYLTSYMFAIELYMLYKEDKEKALLYLKEISLLEYDKESQYYYNIKRFGLYPNLSLYDYSKQVESEALSLKRSK